ncbi:MAG: DUF58 domain-containing protein [Phycisphaerales bacterium]
MADAQGARAEAYLAPETIGQLAPFEVRAKMIVEGVMSGMHRSPYQGMAVEFAEYRQYTPGDDLKHLDWKAFGRTDKLYIKQYQQETNLDVVLMVDSSASMGYGTLPIKGGWGGTEASRRTKYWTKYDHAAALSVAMGYLTLGQADRLGTVTFADDILQIMSRSSSQQQWRRMVQILTAEPVDRKTDLAKVTDLVLSKVTNRVLFIIVSDFFTDPEEIRTALARFRHRRHDVILVQTLDRSEMRFEFDEPAPFEGLEGEGRLRVDPRGLRDGYLEAIGRHTEMVESTATAFGYDVVRVDTHESVGPPLAYLLARRNAMARGSTAR